MIFTLVTLMVVVGAIVYWVLPRYITLSRWCHLFDNFQFPVQEFYTEVERGIEERQLPNVQVGRVTHLQKGFFSAQREYLRIRCGTLIFEICASPYGKGFFVSWWLFTSVSYLESRMAKSNGHAASMFEALTAKSMYQMDQASVFKESIHQAVKDAIEVMTKGKGYRGFSELELKPQDMVAQSQR